jgi:hypothetical protein
VFLPHNIDKRMDRVKKKRGVKEWIIYRLCIPGLLDEPRIAGQLERLSETWGWSSGPFTGVRVALKIDSVINYHPVRS